MAFFYSVVVQNTCGQLAADSWHLWGDAFDGFASDFSRFSPYEAEEWVIDERFYSSLSQTCEGCSSLFSPSTPPPPFKSPTFSPVGNFQKSLCRESGMPTWWSMSPLLHNKVCANVLRQKTCGFSSNRAHSLRETGILEVPYVVFKHTYLFRCLTVHVIQQHFMSLNE